MKMEMEMVKGEGGRGKGEGGREKDVRKKIQTTANEENFKIGCRYSVPSTSKW
jgi:hypothetical protein